MIVYRGGKVVASLTRNIESLFNELIEKEPFPITTIIEPLSKKNGELYIKNPSGWRMKNPNNPTLPLGIDQGGVYVFWWLKRDETSLQPLFDERCERKYEVRGKNVGDEFVKVEIEISDEWLRSYDHHIPLYVGKTAESLLNRIKLHLQINHLQYPKDTSSNQFRRGFNRFFKNYDSSFELIIQHIGFSYIPLHDYDEAVNRFYLEDYAIGKLRAIFNVDIER